MFVDLVSFLLWVASGCPQSSPMCLLCLLEMGPFLLLGQDCFQVAVVTKKLGQAAGNNGIVGNDAFLIQRGIC